MDHLLGFLEHLNAINRGYLLQSDAEAVIVLVRTTTGIHEVSFFADGAIEIQTFMSKEGPEEVSLEDLTEGFKADPTH
jgi:hypothetical protein